MMPEKIIIEIVNPADKPLKKYQAAMESLAKALRVDALTNNHVHEKTEPTPYRALHELSEKVRGQVGAGLRKIFENIVTTWLRQEVTKSGPYDYYEELAKATVGDEPFKLNDRTFINPKTGMPLTTVEYAAMVKDLEQCFGHLFGSTPEALVKQAMALGKLLQSMDPAAAVELSFDDAVKILNNTAPTEDELYRAQRDFADMHTAEMLQDISSTARKKVMATIIDGQKNRISAQQLESNLFDSFVDLNRDWRRVAETETANNFNNGYLVSELQAQQQRGIISEPIFMRGITGAGACSFCRENVKGQVFVLLDAAPSNGDTVTIDGKDYAAIWPGKTNFGRKRAEWWVSAGSQHPHCRCNWVRHTPGWEETDKMFQDMMDKLNAGSMGV